MKKFVFNTRFLGVVLLLLIGLDLFFVASTPAYKYYKRQSARLDERLALWENTFKRDYISAIQNLASSLATNRIASASSPVRSASPSPEVAPILRPLDITRADYCYFEVNGVSGFSLSGRLVFRVGDLFLGRQIVSIDRFGAALSDGGLVRNGLSDRDTQTNNGGEKK